MNKIEQGLVGALPLDGSAAMTGALSLLNSNVKFFRNGDDVFLNSALGFAIISSNAQFVGGVWNRVNIANPAMRVDVRFDGSMVILRAPSGANPIVWDSGSVALDTSKIRFSSGYPEWNDNGTWKGIGGVKNTQRGVATIPADASTYVDVTITSVNMAKSFTTQSQYNSTSNNNSAFATVRLISPTTLRVERSYNAVTTTVAWEVVESY